MEGQIAEGHDTGIVPTLFPGIVHHKHMVRKEFAESEGGSFGLHALISHASKVMLKILKARLQQYMNRELPDVQLVLEKAEEPKIKLQTSTGLLKKQEFQKKHLFLLY